MSGAIGGRHLAAVTLIAISVTACDSGHDAGTPTAKAKASPATEHEARVLSQQQLEDAVVDAHDLPGVRVEEIGMGTEGVGNGVIHAARRTNTSPSLCAPVSAAVDGASGYTPAASVQRTVDSEGRGAILTLVSYHPADTARVLSELRTALKSCKQYTAGPMRATYEDIEATNAPSQGDDGIAFRLKLILTPDDDALPDEEVLKTPVSVTAIRHGSTLAIYKTTSDSIGKPASIPSDLVNAQSKLLDAAAHTTE
ncbi:hypothetical protein [Streptomyces sp. NPDC018610]|uniref:hypothetical protein n=1 Tax=Streptomyces sp. NPDC018610 TaxID=3365049 RepID=UPI0037B0BBF4